MDGTVIAIPLDRIEFHEKPNGKRIQIRFYADEGKLKELAKFCSGERWNEQSWGWMLERLSRSKAKNPRYDLYIGRTNTDIYPLSDMIADHNTGLHYICQHSFDIFNLAPHRFKDYFYESWKPNEIGYLYTKKGNKYLVTSKDISDGFMMSRKGCDEFRDSFTVWIKHCNKDRSLEC